MITHKLTKSATVILVLVAMGCFAAVLMNPSFRMLGGQHLPSSFDQLIAIPEEELGRVDIALMNLLCAEGLPGADGLDVKSHVGLLDQWAGIVKEAERKYLPQFNRNPHRYDNSLGKFKAVNLALTLKQDLGCGYNKDLAASGAMQDLRSTRFFRDSTDLFLHGFTENGKGSCASLPVLMVAVGRRCGYPLFLVACKGHLFCRWDDGRERFNLETACEGADNKSDAYYRCWPHPFEEEELKTEKYLQSLTAAEELGIFCQIRAACLQENQRTKEAVQAYEAALKSFPESKLIKSYLNHMRGEN